VDQRGDRRRSTALTSSIALTVAEDESAALGCAAVIAVMPEFATNLARISNEPLAILLSSPC